MGILSGRFRSIYLCAEVLRAYSLWSVVNEPSAFLVCSLWLSWAKETFISSGFLGKYATTSYEENWLCFRNAFPKHSMQTSVVLNKKGKKEKQKCDVITNNHADWNQTTNKSLRTRSVSYCLPLLSWGVFTVLIMQMQPSISADNSLHKKLVPWTAPRSLHRPLRCLPWDWFLLTKTNKTTTGENVGLPNDL